MIALWSFACGIVFAVGLCLSGMTRPSKVIGFLEPLRGWDASLAFVMASAVLVMAVVWRVAARQKQAWLGGTMPGAAPRTIDGRLLGGAALFGVGWGLSGFCPGPAVVAAASGYGYPLVFVGAMLLGVLAHRLFAARAEEP